MRRSLVTKVYLYATVMVVCLLLSGIGAARLLLETGRLDSVRQFGRDNARFIASELEQTASPRGPDPRRVAAISRGLHAYLGYVPWKDAQGYPPLLASDKIVYEPTALPGPSWHRYWVRLDRPDGQPLGALLVDFEPPRPFPIAGHVAGPLLWLAFLALMLVPPLWYWVLRPINGLVAVAHRLGAGDLTTPVPITRNDELAELEAAFEGLRQRVQQMLRQKEQLLADISHELRGPLSRMAVAVSLLSEDAPMGARLEREIQAMDALIGELLALARAQTPPGQAREAVDLAVIARDLIDARTLTASQAGLELTAALAPAPVEGDPRLLARAMGNLLDNALKYTPAGGHVRVETGPGYFRVVDDGPGVAAGDLPHLFEPFYRPDTSRSRETGGVGLGLAIARAIAQGHGGDATLSCGPLGTVAELRVRV